ncbi:HK97 gp10 family phage protein [Deinococcus sp. HMF7604]|nr:HK97 gp10 family phage protein [Deinococcus betulae]
MAVQGANAGIYLTPAGHYVRTEHYLESIGASSTVQGGQIVVEVFDTAEYASHLEYGELGALTPRAAEQLAAAVGVKALPLQLGRSGTNWIQPNPAITRAAVFAGLRIVNALEAVLSQQAALAVLPSAAD